MQAPNLSALNALQQQLLKEETSKRCSFRRSNRVRRQAALVALLIALGLFLSIIHKSGAYLNLAGTIIIALGVYYGLINLIEPMSSRDLPVTMLRKHVSQASSFKNDSEIDAALAKLYNLFDENPQKWSAITAYERYAFTRFFAKYDAAMIIAGTLCTGVAGFL